MDANYIKTVIRGGNIFITQNADLTNAVRFQTKQNTTYEAEVRAIANRVVNNVSTQSAAYWKRALFRTDASGVLSQISTTQSVAADIEDAAGWQCLVAPDPSTNDILVQVAADGTPTNWNISVDIFVADTKAVAGGF